MVDDLSQLRLDQQQLAALEEGAVKGAVPEVNLRQARRNVQQDVIAVHKAERTLRSWRLIDAEINAVKAEAEEILNNKAGLQADQERHRDWAKVEVRAPFAGTIVEMNATVGDIVDTTTDLFKVSDMRTLTVWADAYEEDLPALLRVMARPPESRIWTIRFKADPAAPPLQGQIDYISPLIDPNQHTALVTGRVANPEDRLRGYQFIVATVPCRLLRER